MASPVYASGTAAGTKIRNVASAPYEISGGTEGVDCSFQISPSGQTSPYTFQILGGALPAGFTRSSSGLVTGVGGCS